MKWTKLGLIYEPSRGGHCWMSSHASVPFADHLHDDIFRIYFSSRDAEKRSFTIFIEIDVNRPGRVIRVPDHPVLSPGSKGSFDDNGAMLSWIVSNDDTKYLYYIGWNLGVSIPFRNAIGLALSDSSGVFQKYSNGPIMDRSPFDPYFVASSCVRIEEGMWRMWYLSCVKWELINAKPRHWYHIKLAQSKDGISWFSERKVCIDFKSRDEYAISRPCVLKDGNIYKMWYSFRGQTYRIGYAESVDGINWVRMDDDVGVNVSDSGWDSEMIEYPFVFDHKGNRYMLYNGNGYGATGFGLAVLEKD